MIIDKIICRFAAPFTEANEDHFVLRRIRFII